MMKKWSHVIENSRKYYGRTNEVNQERNNKKLTSYAAKIIVDMEKKRTKEENVIIGGEIIL